MGAQHILTHSSSSLNERCQAPPTPPALVLFFWTKDVRPSQMRLVVSSSIECKLIHHSPFSFSYLLLILFYFIFLFSYLLFIFFFYIISLLPENICKKGTKPRTKTRSRALDKKFRTISPHSLIPYLSFIYFETSHL